MTGSIQHGTDMAHFLIWAVIVILVILICFIPTIIAFWRQHHYKWIIFVLNITGVGWVPSFVWAVWPRRTPLLGVVVNDPVSNSVAASASIYHQYGNNVKAFRRGSSLENENYVIGSAYGNTHYKNHILEYVLTIGRNPSCDVVISESSVSRLHARLYVYSDNKMTLEDAVSTYGTYKLGLDGIKVRVNSEEVNEYDVVYFGNSELTVSDLIKK